MVRKSYDRIHGMKLIAHQKSIVKLFGTADSSIRMMYTSCCNQSHVTVANASALLDSSPFLYDKFSRNHHPHRFQQEVTNSNVQARVDKKLSKITLSNEVW